MNTYAYVGGNPISYSDSRGLFLDSVTAACIQDPAFCLEIGAIMIENHGALSGDACTKQAADEVARRLRGLEPAARVIQVALAFYSLGRLAAEAVAAAAGAAPELAAGAKAASNLEKTGETVLIDSNAAVQIGKDPTLGGRLLEGERGVVSYVTRPELRNAVANGNLKGVPRALDGLDVLTQRPSIDAIINFRGGLLRANGRFGDGIIGAQALEFGIPLITNDTELAAALRAAGGVVR